MVSNRNALPSPTSPPEAYYLLFPAQLVAAKLAHGSPSKVLSSCEMGEAQLH